jgi:type IV secretion system protein VirB11
MEVMVNEPGTVFVERHGQMEQLPVPALTFNHLRILTEQAASYAAQPEVGTHNPLLSARLPGGSRLQCVLPPATLDGHVVLAIRQSVMKKLTLDQFAAQGGYRTTTAALTRRYPEALTDLYRTGNFPEFIKAAIKARCTLLVSGGTSSGKTTYLNACVHGVNSQDRLICIEDTRELEPEQPNVARLLFPRQSAGQTSQLTARGLVQASLRLRPDRIIFGEIRGPEAFDFLTAINTGHPGSMATLHANSAAEALRRLTTLVHQADVRMSDEAIRDYIQGTIDVIVQVARTGPDQCGVTEVLFAGA